MNRPTHGLAAMCALLDAGIAGGQGMIMDVVANEVVTKYKTATCEQMPCVEST